MARRRLLLNLSNYKNRYNHFQLCGQSKPRIYRRATILNSMRRYVSKIWSVATTSAFLETTNSLIMREFIRYFCRKTGVIIASLCSSPSKITSRSRSHWTHTYFSITTRAVCFWAAGRKNSCMTVTNYWLFLLWRMKICLNWTLSAPKRNRLLDLCLLFELTSRKYKM